MSHTPICHHRRPRSCSKKGTDFQRTWKHQCSAEDTTQRAKEMCFKRSNSLQNVGLNTIRKEPSRGPTQINYRPIRMTWMSNKKLPSEENCSSETWKNIFDVHTAASKSERKSIDIFLINKFNNVRDTSAPQEMAMPADLSESGPYKLTLPPEEPTEPHPVDVANSISQDQPREKKVTFILENATPKKLTAEMRRLNFRNSYSKGSRNNPSLGSQTDKLSCDSGGASAPPKNPTSVTSNESGKTEIPTMNSVSPAMVKQTNIGAVRLKPTTVKRKLKSCRSRSFHKSLDSSSVYQNTKNPFSYIKPLKAVHREVVTMISLVNTEEPGEQTGKEVVNVTTECEASPSKNVIQCKQTHRSITDKSNVPDQPSAGILKAKPFEKKTEGIQTEEKRKQFSSPFGKFLSLDETCNSVSDDKLSGRTRSFESENADLGNDPSTGCIHLQSLKEKECWSSFHKMTKKGIFVSFDTILRGLLTPTEYRLRRNELGVLVQEQR